eukprot:tig00000042_g15618.t1
MHLTRRRRQVLVASEDDAGEEEEEEGGGGEGGGVAYEFQSSLMQVDAEGAAVLAHHFVLAGDAARSRPYLEVCAAAAHEAHANLEAARLYEDLLRMNPQAPPVDRARWLRLRGETAARLEMHGDAVGFCLRGLEALGRPVPRSGLARRLSSAWGAFLNKFRPLPPEDAVARLRKARRPGPPFPLKAASLETIRLLRVLGHSAQQSGAAGVRGASVGPYCVSKQARLALRYPGMDEPTAIGYASVARLCAAQGRDEAALRWAGLAVAVAGALGRQSAWEAVLPTLCDAFLRTSEMEVAGAALASWTARALKFRNKNCYVNAGLHRAGVALRCSAAAAFPPEADDDEEPLAIAFSARNYLEKEVEAGPGRAGHFASELRAALAAHGREPDLLDDAHLAKGHVAVAVVRMLQARPAPPRPVPPRPRPSDEAAEALYELEAQLAGRLGGAVASGAAPFFAVVGLVHAEVRAERLRLKLLEMALWRAFGPGGTALDGRPAARVAVDAARAAAAHPKEGPGDRRRARRRGRRGALRGPAARDGRRRLRPHPLLLPASALLPAAAPAGPPPPRPALPGSIKNFGHGRRASALQTISEDTAGGGSAADDEGPPSAAEMRAALEEACGRLRAGLWGCPAAPPSRPRRPASRGRRGATWRARGGCSSGRRRRRGRRGSTGARRWRWRCRRRTRRGGAAGGGGGRAAGAAGEAGDAFLGRLARRLATLAREAA